MDPDLGNVPGLHQAQVSPGAARVGGFVHPITVRHVAPDRILPSSRVHHVGIRLADRDRADRAPEIPIRDGRPVGAAVGGLEHAPAGRAHVVLVGARRRARRSHRSPTPEGTDAAPGQCAQGRRVDGLGGEGSGHENGSDEAEERAHGGLDGLRFLTRRRENIWRSGVRSQASGACPTES